MVSLPLVQLWNIRSLIFHFSKLEIKRRYKESYLGFLWMALEPLFIFILLYVVFTPKRQTKLSPEIDAAEGSRWGAGALAMTKAKVRSPPGPSSVMTQLSSGVKRVSPLAVSITRVAPSEPRSPEIDTVVEMSPAEVLRRISM